jgi:hypothetical protein
VLLAAEVFVVVGLAQPASLARLLARRPACRFGAVFLAVAQARIATEQLPAAQASSSSRFGHGITELQVQWRTRIMTGTASSADAAGVYAVIPITVFTLIDAGTASSSAFRRKPKGVHDHAGIRVHVRPESAFTMRWKPRSRWAGICTLGSPPSHA